jgi:hypothetical protein
MLKRSLPWNINFAPEETDATGAGEGSGSSQNDDNPSASSAEETETETRDESTLEDVVQEVVDSHSTEAEDEESGSKTEPDKGEKGEEEGEGKDDLNPDGTKKELTAEQKQAEADKQLPFHNHPRFQEIIKERNDLRNQVQEFEAAKPLAAQQQSVINFCQQNNISPEQFQQGLSFLAMLNTNPAEAYKQLKPIMEQLESYDGARLPKDLEDEVAEGKLPLERAQEIATLRAQGKSSEFRGRVTAEQQAQQLQRANMNALGAWEQNTMGRDPDFKPKADKNAPDGKYELTVTAFQGLLAQNPPKNPQEVVALIQRAYDQINRVWTTRLTPRQPKGQRQIPSHRSSGKTADKDPETLDEALAPILAKHGVN